MGRPVTQQRAYLVAANLKNGDSASEACRKAGVPESVVRCRASKIAKSEAVKVALLEIETGFKPGELGKMAKARIAEKLVKPPKEAKTALGFFRTALELDGMIGGPSELHLHQHSHLPPAVEKMLLDKMREIQAQEVIDAEVISSEDQKDHGGVQGGELTLGFQDRTIG